MLTLVMTATCPSTTLVASQVPPSPTSMTPTSTATSANHRNTAASTTSKYDGSSPISRSTSAMTRNCSSSSASSIGSPFTMRRSLTRSRCGLVVVPTRSPAVDSSSVTMRVADVFPFVPVRWTAGYSSCGDPRYSRSARMRSSVGRASLAGRRRKTHAGLHVDVRIQPGASCEPVHSGRSGGGELDLDPQLRPAARIPPQRSCPPRAGRARRAPARRGGARSRAR